MKDLKAGKITTKEAQATAKIAANIIYTSRLELENKRMEIKLARSVPLIDQKYQTITALVL
jgi:hypothetical protein